VILGKRRMTNQVLDLYRRVASGGVALIITGDFSVVPKGMLEETRTATARYSYGDVRIEGFEKLVDAVRGAAPHCRIVAQLSGEYPGLGPSDVPSPFTAGRPRPLSSGQVQSIIGCFVESIAGVREEGFDGVQLHAAHGGLLSRFLSPYANRRNDKYGGSAENRARIIREIVSGARSRVGDFPIMIKMNCTDYLEGGIGIDSFPELATEIEKSGIDAIEVSGGMRDCLIRTEEELGFRPVPAPESHTRIKNSDKQSYFLKYAERLQVDIPVILVGGNRDIESLERLVRQGKVEFVALCRPLISEPDLPNRWLEGRGSSGTDCISCNSCIYHMRIHLERGEPEVVTCLLKHDRRQVREAQQWLSSWVKRNTVPSPATPPAPPRP
jgi:2,4-dienoyl-CoA reductase-like NADH-dependent reductase (Old Yellow Enzyme family)